MPEGSLCIRFATSLPGSEEPEPLLGASCARVQDDATVKVHARTSNRVRLTTAMLFLSIFASVSRGLTQLSSTRLLPATDIRKSGTSSGALSALEAPEMEWPPTTARFGPGSCQSPRGFPATRTPGSTELPRSPLLPQIRQVESLPTLPARAPPGCPAPASECRRMLRPYAS